MPRTPSTPSAGRSARRRTPRSCGASAHAPSEPEPLERLGIAPPTGPDLHDELEEHCVADERLHLRSCTRPDLADHRAALADENALLRLGLDEDARADGLVVELVDLDG